MALTSMLETKSAEVYTLRSLLEELKNNLVVAESLVQEKELALADNAAALSKQLASENEALEEQRAAMTKRIKASEVAMQEVQEACEVTVQELKHKQQEEIDVIQEELDALKEAKKRTEEAMMQTAQALEEVRGQLASITVERDETLQRTDELEKSHADLHTRLTDMTKQCEGKAQELESETTRRATLEKDVAAQEEQITTMKAFVDELSATMHNLEQSKKDADKRATHAEARCEELSTELGTANSNSQEIQRSHESLTTRVSELEADRQSVDEQRRDALERLKASEAKYEEEMARRKEPSRVERQLKDKEDELATMKAFVDELSATMHYLEQSKKDADKRATDAEARCEELSSELDIANEENEKVSLSLSQTRGMLRREERMDREDKNMRGNSASTGVSTHDVAHATTQTHGSSARARSPRHTNETASSHLTRRVAELEEQCRALQMSEAAARVELSREIQGHEDLKLMMRHRAYIAEHDCEKLAAVRALDYLNEELLQTTLQLEKARAEKSAPSLWS